MYLPYNNGNNPGGNSGFDVDALRRLDPGEFERLYDAYAPELARYLTNLCGDAQAAQDILQETFIKVYKALPRTRIELELRPWLYKIATNTARSTMRLSYWKRRLVGYAGAGENKEIPVADLFDSRYAEREMIEHALAAIKPDYAAALLLHWKEDFSITEMCSILGISQSTLKKRLYRAKRAFIEAYNDERLKTETR